MEIKHGLVWDEKFSVGVVEIDNQHKLMIETINELIEAVGENPSEQKLAEIIKKLVEYKKYHFETEEKYFDLYKYEGAEEHKAEHAKFGERLAKLQEESKGNSIMLAFGLVDFLEDWLIDHLMNMDQKYVECFKKAGLK